MAKSMGVGVDSPSPAEAEEESGSCDAHLFNGAILSFQPVGTRCCAFPDFPAKACFRLKSADRQIVVSVFRSL